MSWLKIRARQYGGRWAAMVERPDRTQTAADGHFHFLDLPDGAYTLIVSLPGFGSRYGTAQAQASVARDAQGKIAMAGVEITLPPTTIAGQITGKDSAAVVMARVQVKGSGESAFSDGQGHYLLAGLEVGSRTLLVSAQGYQPVSQTVAISQAGATQTLNLALVPS
jgi:hypothetical protein